MSVLPEDTQKLNMEEGDGDSIKEQSQHDDEADGGRLMVYAQNSSRLQRFRYYYQHPYFRIFVAYFVVICNFFIYAEDPVAHSYGKCVIPIVGNAFSFIFTKYPANGFSALKLFMWLIVVVLGIIVGKLFFHHFLFKRIFKLSMFSNDQGSWMICFLVTIISLVIGSFIYNAFASISDTMGPYIIDGYIGARNHTFMRAAALGTWGGDFLTAWMVTDMMLQDTKKYPRWALGARRWWNQGIRRVIFFWVFSITLTVLVVTVICTNIINWDRLNRDVFYTNETGRSFLASFILVMDFTIVMQDWDFPLFQSNLDVKLPGLNTANINFKIPQCLRRQQWTIYITGKWFNYGILFFVMILDLNMWKNQIFYKPLDFAQYLGPDDHIYSVEDPLSLSYAGNTTIYSYVWRNSTIDPLTNATYVSADTVTNSRYRSSPLSIRGLAFIPSIVIFIMFGALIYVFGREGTAQYEAEYERRQTVKITKIKRKESPDHIDAAVKDYGATDERDSTEQPGIKNIEFI